MRISLVTSHTHIQRDTLDIQTFTCQVPNEAGFDALVLEKLIPVVVFKPGGKSGKGS